MTATAPTAVQRKATAGADADEKLQLRKETNLWRDAWHRLLRNKLAVMGMLIILLFLLLAIFADLIAPYRYDESDFTKTYLFPSLAHPFGTSPLGQDMLSRLIYGARVSMIVGLGAQVLVILIGVPLGAIAGYYGGKIDLYLMRFVDVMYAFPTLLFVILIMSALGPGLVNIFIALGLTGWVTLCRLTRGQLLSLREKEFVLAARSVGAKSGRIIIKHLLPNALTPIIIALTFGIPQAIFTEAALSFIGVGISPPTPSWGQMVGEYQKYIRGYWYLATFPTIAIALTMLSFSFLGDGLRDALDPRMKR
jgi:ABC-type dipeptide/oligopeptide/nickel transport system permease subunit